MIPKALLINQGSRLRGTLIVAAAVALLAGCSTYDSVTQRFAQAITPYRITVVQGNFVSKEAAAQMQVGMSRAQVRQVLGTPLLTDMFHADRWDYVFYFKRGSRSIVQQRDFIVNFTGDRVASWSGGDDLPSNLELLAEIDGERTGKKVTVAPVVASAASGAVAASAPAATAAVPGSTPDTVRSATSDASQAGNLPVVDPKKVLAPVQILRGEYDGIATVADLEDFYNQLPSGDRQFVIIPGAAHSLVLAKNRQLFWHAVHSFFTMPAPVAI